MDTSRRLSSPGAPAPEVVRAAFRDLHGSRLHGFALLVTLGDRALAARLSAEALAAAASRTDQLRHPERAAAWLRAHVTRSLPRGHRNPAPAERRAGLEPLGVDDAVIGGLSALRPRERAALVAIAVERLDRRDVETIVGRHGDDLDRLLARARRAYATAFGATPPAHASTDDGPIAARISHVAARMMQ